MATCWATLIAKVVLPMPGRPATMISVPPARPCVMRSRSTKPLSSAEQPLARPLLEHLERLVEDLRQRHEAAPDRLLAERHHRLLGARQRVRRVEAAVEAVARDLAADVDQPAPDRALLDDLDVVLEAAEIGQVGVEAGEVGESAGALDRSLLLEPRLQRPQVDRGVLVLQLEHRGVDRPDGDRRRSPRPSAARKPRGADAGRAAPRRARRAPTPRSAAWPSRGRADRA